MSLKRQVASGMFWVTVAQFAGQGMTMFVGLILPKLLTPSQMGLMGMAMLAVTALELFQDAGLESALIYRREGVKEASDTVFVVVIIISLFICLVIMAAAPLIAHFFREPAVIPILRVLAITVPISSFGRVPYVLLGRELNFRRRMFPELTSSLIASIVVLVLAFSGFGVWSLVWREIVKNTLATILVWPVSSYRPRLRFDLPIARELFDYGKHIVSSQALIFLITNIDNAFVGRFAGKTALGQYQWAYNLTNRPATMINRTISQVMFPTFSKLADGDRQKVREIRARYYLTLVRYVTWIMAPITLAMILFASDFILDLYSKAWAPAIVPLQLLAVYGFIRAVAANMGSVFRAMGKPHWLSNIALWRLITMAVGLYIVLVPLGWGITGVSWLSVVVAVVDFIIGAVLVGRLMEAPASAYVRRMLPALIAALAAGLIAHWLYPQIPLARAAFRLLAAGVVLMLFYAAFIWFADGEFRVIVRTGMRMLRQMWAQRGARGLTPAPPAAGEEQ
jgi:PST family polysaccharide transporter/lipopolysaccharide exporter